MKLQKRIKLPMDQVNSGLKYNRVPSASVAIASVLAKWFDTIIKYRKIVPNDKEEYTFAVLRSHFEKNTGRAYISGSLRNAMKDYGYRLRLQGSEIVITKFR